MIHRSQVAFFTSLLFIFPTAGATPIYFPQFFASTKLQSMGDDIYNFSQGKNLENIESVRAFIPKTGWNQNYNSAECTNYCDEEITRIIREFFSAESANMEVSFNSQIVKFRKNLTKLEVRANGKTQVVPLTPPSQECRTQGQAWVDSINKQKSKIQHTVINSKDVYLIFNKEGEVCFQNNAIRIASGDSIRLGLFGTETELNGARLETAECSLEPFVARLIDEDTDVPRPPEGQTLITQSSQLYTIKRMPPAECFTSEFQVHKKRGTETQWTKKINQYERFHGTFQIGVLNTDLQDRKFKTNDFGDGPVIYSEEGDSKGPEFVGSLVLYGFPHYFTSFFDNKRHYAGRDIVNEKQWADRTGFVISVGLDNPEDNFGFGLSFEIVKGVNLTASKFYKKVDKLHGYSEGDAFVDNEVPTKKEWDNAFVMGLSLDFRYLSKFF